MKIISFESPYNFWMVYQLVKNVIVLLRSDVSIQSTLIYACLFSRRTLAKVRICMYQVSQSLELYWYFFALQYRVTSIKSLLGDLEFVLILKAIVNLAIVDGLSTRIFPLLQGFPQIWQSVQYKCSFRFCLLFCSFPKFCSPLLQDYTAMYYLKILEILNTGLVQKWLG